MTLPALLLFTLTVRADEGVPANRFVFAQLRHGGNWDPYPALWPQLAGFIEQTTSVAPWPERRVIAASDPKLFESPFLLIAGRGPFALSETEGQALRRYVAGGGFVFVDGTEAERNGPFARSAAAALAALFPGAAWEPVPADHAVFRSFFLVRNVAGRRLADERLRGLRVQDRIAAVLCANDLQGAVVRDNLGQYLNPCEPGGDAQRQDSWKLMLNLVIYGLTGTYKTDAIHQPFIEQKLRQ